MKMNDASRKKLQWLQILSNRVIHSALSGNYLSAFKGSGLDFDQLREYVMGDDIRMLDWKSSARSNQLMVKQYREERERTVIVAIDNSASLNGSSETQLKKDLAIDVAASLSFIAAQGKDKVGLLVFSDHIEAWIPPARGVAHLARVTKELASCTFQNKRTDMSSALEFLVQLKLRSAILFLVSDFVIDTASCKRLFEIVGIEYDAVALRLLDKTDRVLPPLGFIELEDPETGELFMVDTREFSDKPGFDHALIIRLLSQKKELEKSRVDVCDLWLHRPFIDDLVSFFTKRIRRRSI